MEFNEQVKAAASRLASRLSPWFTGPRVGIATENGRTVLVVYLSSRRNNSQVPQEWEGYPVRVDYSGNLRPLSEHPKFG